MIWEIFRTLRHTNAVNAACLSKLAFAAALLPAWLFISVDLETLEEVPTSYMCKHFHNAALRSNPVLQFFHEVTNAAWGCSYLIYEGSFGCRARWHVGPIQVESPRGETTVHIRSGGKIVVTYCSRLYLAIITQVCFFRSSIAWKKHSGILYPASLGHQGLWLLFWEK